MGFLWLDIELFCIVINYHLYIYTKIDIEVPIIMKITIAGGNGAIAMLLHPKLKANGHHVKALIRNPDQAEEVKSAGAEPVICDLEKDKEISESVGDAGLVIFAAGAGPGSGAARKWTVDRDGAIKLIDAAKKQDARYIMISAMGLDTPRGDGVFQTYQKAKAEADMALRNSGLSYVIVKPGRLTDEPGTGKVAVGNLERGSVTREDVASVIAELVETPEIENISFDLLNGDVPVEEAVARLK